MFRAPVTGLLCLLATSTFAPMPPENPMFRLVPKRFGKQNVVPAGGRFFSVCAPRLAPPHRGRG
jgi:hypothetical protein